MLGITISVSMAGPGIGMGPRGERTTDRAKAKGLRQGSWTMTIDNDSDHGPWTMDHGRRSTPKATAAATAHRPQQLIIVTLPLRPFAPERQSHPLDMQRLCHLRAARRLATLEGTPSNPSTSLADASLSSNVNVICQCDTVSMLRCFRCCQGCKECPGPPRAGLAAAKASLNSLTKAALAVATAAS